jgi:hypothetical protein
VNEQVFFIRGPMPNLNELLGAKRKLRGRSDDYARVKRLWTDRIVLFVRAAGLVPVRRAILKYELREPNRRRDPSNVTSATVKFIEDALVKEGILPNDGWEHIVGFSVVWTVDKRNPGVVVTIEEPKE